MLDMTLANVGTWLLGLAFLIGGVVNLKGSPSINADFRRWGYSERFHYVAGLLQVVAAVLLLFPDTRLAGLAVAGFVCMAAALTLIVHREFRHLPPSLILIVLLIVEGLGL